MHIGYICEPNRFEWKRVDTTVTGAAEEVGDPEQILKKFGIERNEGGRAHAEEVRF